MQNFALIGRRSSEITRREKKEKNKPQQNLSPLLQAIAYRQANNTNSPFRGLMNRSFTFMTEHLFEGWYVVDAFVGRRCQHPCTSAFNAFSLRTCALSYESLWTVQSLWCCVSVRDYDCYDWLFILFMSNSFRFGGCASVTTMDEATSFFICGHQDYMTAAVAPCLSFCCFFQLGNFETFTVFKYRCISAAEIVYLWLV